MLVFIISCVLVLYNIFGVGFLIWRHTFDMSPMTSLLVRTPAAAYH